MSLAAHPSGLLKNGNPIKTKSIYRALGRYEALRDKKRKTRK